MAALVDRRPRRPARGVAARPAPDRADRAASERFALQPVAIEDLLGRPQVPLDRAGMARLIEGRARAW